MKSSNGLLISHRCPQCGAGISLSDTQRLFQCGFCKVRFYMTTGSFFRYILPDSAPEGEELIYVPYWHMRGMNFSVTLNGVESRVVDSSLRALDMEFLPLSLGVRPQAAPMRFACQTDRASFIRPSQDHTSVLSLANAVSSAFSEQERYASAFIGDRISIIYLPIYTKGRAFYDALSNRPVSGSASLWEDTLNRVDDFSGDDVRFLSALCPECGWDMDAGRDGIVLICRNCKRLYTAEKSILRKVEAVFCNAIENGAYYAPFWKTSAKWHGVNLGNLSELIKFANLPRAVMEGFEKREIYFWSPAFRVNPSLYLRLSRQLTAIQPVLDASTVMPENVNFIHATMDAGEAVKSLIITASALATTRQITYPILTSVHIEAASTELVYIPFSLRMGELIQPDMGFAMPMPARAIV